MIDTWRQASDVCDGKCQKIGRPTVAASSLLHALAPQRRGFEYARKVQRQQSYGG
jgi:hypothetical protein